MLLSSLALLVAAFVLYLAVPALLIYWHYPWPVYALLLAAVGLAVGSKRRGALRYATIGVTGLLTGLFFFETIFVSQLHRQRLAVAVGDHFPDFTLQTSTKEPFSPTQLAGKSAALYIFYRGDW
jgi:hypothetical protein